MEAFFPNRVLMTADTIGGVWTFAIELAASLSERRIEVMLAALGGPVTSAQRREVTAIPRLQLVESHYKLEWMEDPWRDVEDSGAWLLEVENKFAPDVVHLNSLGHGALPWRNPTVLTAHSCVASWWEAVRYEPLPESWNRYRTHVARSLKSVAQVTAPSRSMASTLSRSYGFPIPSCVIPNGRSAAEFHPTAKEPFMLAAGRLWDEAKNISTLVQVAPQLPWPVYLAGDAVSSAGSTMSAEDCRMTGKLSTTELASYYARAAIYALPARYEPFGLSVLEAALSGCALVLGDIDSLRENWDGAAAFVPPDDADALADTLRMLIADDSRRESLSGQSLARAQNLTPHRMAASYLSVYRNAMEGCYACAS